MGFEEATPIQSQAIPDGFIRCGRYRTGSDRNRQDSSFGFRFTESRPVFTENADFVLSPTRELAIQVADETVSWQNICTV